MGPNIDAGIIKRVLHAGTKPAKFKTGSKVHFHFQTRLRNQEKTIIDDSKKIGDGKPMHIILGKKFKLEVWEAIIQKMAVKEVAQFIVDKSLVMQYPFVSKTLRDAQVPAEHRKGHCCAMTLQQAGIGYDDLNNLMKDPCDLEFTIELVNVEDPDGYHKESWQLNDEEQLQRVNQLKDLGNVQYKQMNPQAASDMYAEAIGLLERLMIKEKPHTEEWENLNKMKLPLLLNYSQCKLGEGDYYSAIEHCSSVLQVEPDNVKALFRRGKAHVGAWNPVEAREDFEKVIQLDKSLGCVVKKELDNLDELVKLKNDSDKEKLKGLFNK
ncbi:hypothetical protein RN001_014579 [Aquatica leii]|uniref:AIP/AIPL N-terminal FKBP-type PPIase domain-containing protein n=1 Tax=Aquatica leii TaxID=1421715 RepID=A0AAN7SN74_9COLE|nr:hypothetical protein RN001_014579 [Aquatica leii]